MDEKYTFSEKQLSRLRIEYSQLDDNEFDTFIEQAERLELDPFSRQIYAVKKDGSRMQVLCTVDGLRIVAERSSKYAGQTPAMWCGNDGVWKDVWLEKTPPAACKIGVMRSDFAQPLYAVARFDSYNQVTSYWTSMPDIMISKCAEALALRRAFPARLSGCYPVIGLDFNASRRKIALELGADAVFSPDEPGLKEKILTLTGGGCNSVIEVTGNPQAVVQGLEMTARFGRFALVGCNRTPTEKIDFYNLVHRPGISVIGAHNMARPQHDRQPGVWTMKDDMAVLLRYLSAKRLKTRPLLTRIADPAEAPEIYAKLFARDLDVLGVVYDWRKY